MSFVTRSSSWRDRAAVRWLLVTIAAPLCLAWTPAQPVTHRDGAAHSAVSQHATDPSARGPASPLRQGRRAARARIKPSLRRFHTSFVAAVTSVDPASGRIDPAALENLVAAAHDVQSAQTDLRIPAADQTDADEAATTRRIVDRVRGNAMIDQREVPDLYDAVLDLGVVPDDRAARRQMRAKLNRAAVRPANVALKTIRLDWDLSAADDPATTWFPAHAALGLQRPHDGTQPIVLEVDPARVDVDRASVHATVGGEQVALHPRDVSVQRGRLVLKNVPPGTHKLAMSYRLQAVTPDTGGSGLLRSGDGKYVGTLTWPYYFGQIAPGVSNPNDKVRVTIHAKGPPGAVVMTNASPRGGPAYNAAMVALTGFEHRESRASNGVPIELWQRPGTAGPALQRRIFRGVGRAVTMLHEAFGLRPRLPQGRLRYVEALSDAFSMEHDGLIAMAPSVLASTEYARDVAIHEFVHHFFGNGVRVRNWDFWMSEGFTTYWTTRVVEDLDGPAAARHRYDLGRVAAQRAFGQSPHPLAAGRDTDVLTAFDKIPYEYGAWVLRMIETRLGRPEFDRLMRDFVRRYVGRSADTRTFARFMTRNNTKGLDVAQFLTEWNGLTQVPRVHVDGVGYADDRRTLRLNVRNLSRVPAGLTIPVRATLADGTQPTFDLDVSTRADGVTRSFPSPVRRLEFDPDRTTLVDLSVQPHGR